MPKCTVKNCGNTSDRKISGKRIRFLSFPVNSPEICAEWVKFTGRPLLNPRTARMCSAHFEPSCFKKDWREDAYGYDFVPKRRVRIIKPDSIPTLTGFCEINDEWNVKSETKNQEKPEEEDEDVDSDENGDDDDDEEGNGDEIASNVKTEVVRCNENEELDTTEAINPTNLDGELMKSEVVRCNENEELNTAEAPAPQLKIIHVPLSSHNDPGNTMDHSLPGFDLPIEVESITYEEFNEKLLEELGQMKNEVASSNKQLEERSKELEELKKKLADSSRELEDCKKKLIKFEVGGPRDIELARKKLDDYKKDLESRDKELDRRAKQLKKVFENCREQVIAPLSNVFTPGQIKQLLNPNISRIKWSDDDISSAIALRNISPKAYEYLREVRKLPLPGMSTLRRWASETDFSEGILKPVMTHMKIKGREMGELEKLVVLSIDKMNLSNKMAIDKKQMTIIGPHSYCQCVVARGLYGKWKTPVYYAYDKPLNVSTLFQIIENLYDKTFTVVAIVCDVEASNLALWSDLNIDHETNCFFQHPSNDKASIFTFADAPELLKILRNYFIDSEYNYNGKIISKECVEQLLLTEITGCTLTHNVTQHHLDLQERDRHAEEPAAELFSKPLATSLDFLGQNGLLEGFDWKETADFLRIVADWFEVFNSQMTSGSPTIQVFGLNLKKQNEILSRMSKLVHQLRVGSEKNMLPFQEAILLNNTALPQFSSYLKARYHTESQPVQCLFTRRLTLDVIKEFFVSIKDFGPSDEQLGALDFTYRMKWYILGRNSAPTNLNDPDDVEDVPGADLILTNDFRGLYAKRKLPDDPEGTKKKHCSDDSQIIELVEMLTE